MLNIYYARESVDKDRFIFDHISGKSILLVPDQYTLEAEKKAFGTLGVSGLMDLEVLDFARLSDRILSECGRDRRVHINKYGRHMLLSHILLKLEGELSVYEKYRRSAPFIEMMNNFLAQIRLADISAEDLESIRDRTDEDSLLHRKMDDLCLIYREYEEVIGDRYVDTEMMIDVVAEKIGESDNIRNTEVWISGFDSFTEKNLNVIEALSNHAPDVNVVLTYAKGCRDEEVFAATRTVIDKLKKRVSDIHICQIEGYEREMSPAIAAVEQELFSVPAIKHYDFDGIEIVKASNVYSQLESAATYITHLVRDEGMRYRDIALVCNNLEENQAVIKRIFDMYDIPLFMDMKRDVMSSSLITFILLSLDMVNRGFNTSDMMRLYKCGIWDIPGEDIASLENYCIEYRIDGHFWERDFRRGKKEYEPEELAAINETRRKAADDILSFREVYRDASTMNGKIRALYQYMSETCRMAETIEKEADILEGLGYLDEGEILKQIWNIICDLLDQIDEIMGDMPASDEDLPEMLKAGLADVETGIIPQSSDSISVGTCQRSRLGNVKAVVVLCADEGVLPASSASEMLLTNDEISVFEDKDIEFINIDKTRRAEETLGIYRTLSRPDKYLWIGTSSQDLKGDSLKPSSVISSIERIFPEITEKQDVINSPDALSKISADGSTTEHIVSALRDALEGEELKDEYMEAAGVLKEKTPDRYESIEKGLFFSPAVKDVDVEKLLEAYSRGRSELTVSPSALERYGRCPFSYFVSYALSPSELRVHEMAAREIGDAYHHVFKKLAGRLTVPGVDVTGDDSPWMTISKDEYETLIDELVTEEISGYRDGVMTETPEDAYRAGRLREVISDIGWILIEHTRKGEVKEGLYEEWFGRRGKIPPVEVDVDGRKVYVEGIIDRMDVLPDGSIKIIDYKTGNDKFSEKEARSGWKLQLMIYLMAGMGYQGIERKPAGVFYFNIKDDVISQKKYLEELSPEKLMADFRLEGAMVNDENVIRSIAGEFTDASDVAKVSRNKDGSYSAYSRLIDPDEFDDFIDEVAGKVTDLVTGITKGEISPDPAKKESGGMSACTYCDYRSFCGFDTAFDNCKYRWI